jgi:hypothetical protein
MVAILLVLLRTVETVRTRAVCSLKHILRFFAGYTAIGIWVLTSTACPMADFTFVPSSVANRISSEGTLCDAGAAIDFEVQRVADVAVGLLRSCAGETPVEAGLTDRALKKVVGETGALTGLIEPSDSAYSAGIAVEWASMKAGLAAFMTALTGGSLIEEVESMPAICHAMVVSGSSNPVGFADCALVNKRPGALGAGGVAREVFVEEVVDIFTCLQGVLLTVP